MSTISAVTISLLICVVAAALEGLFAGKKVKPFLEKLRKPRFAPPLWVWAIVGVLYYLICFFILFRLFRYEDNASPRYISLALLLAVMILNAVWNYVFFRLENLAYSFALSIFYSLVAVALFLFLWQFDYLAAYVLIPYLVYLFYAFYWGWGLLKLNPK